MTTLFERLTDEAKERLNEYGKTYPSTVEMITEQLTSINSITSLRWSDAITFNLIMGNGTTISVLEFSNYFNN
jgi:hypothetical protein